MSLFTASTTLGDLGRLRDILTTVFERGFGYALARLRIAWLVPWECRIRCFFKACLRMGRRPPTQENLPENIRELLVALGPTFVKFGQVLSVRPDILPQPLCQELAKLTDQVPAVPFDQVKKVVEADLGKPLTTLFRHFDRQPIAAASLSQVHAATLPTGEHVAVKVQRPGIRPVIEKDIHIMLALATLVEERLPEWKVYRPVALVKEFADTIMRELDFTVEAIHAKRFAAMFAETPTVKVAKIFEPYTTSRILTMEQIRGIHVNDLPRLKKSTIDLKALAKNGVSALLTQVFLEGFFHADPHPGNYFALPGNVFAFVDYGMVGRLSADHRRELASFFISFLNQDSEAAISHLKHLVDIPEGADVPAFEHNIDDILNQWYGTKLQDVSLAHTFFAIMESGRRNRIFFPSQLAYLGKALFTTEAMGRALDPKFDFGRELAPFVQKILAAELSPAKLSREIADRALDYLSYLEKLPEATVTFLEKIDKGEVGVRINSEELRQLQVQFHTDNIKRTTTTVLAAFLFALAASYLLETKLLSIHLSPTTVGLTFLIVLLLWWLRR